MDRSVTLCPSQSMLSEACSVSRHPSSKMVLGNDSLGQTAAIFIGSTASLKVFVAIGSVDCPHPSWNEGAKRVTGPPSKVPPSPPSHLCTWPGVGGARVCRLEEA